MNDRDDRLLRILEATVPSPTDRGDWDEILRRATPRPWSSRDRRLVPVAAVAALTVVLAILLVQADDTGQVQPATTIPGTPVDPPPSAGEVLFRENGCFACHMVGTAGATGPGPNLTNQGLRGRGLDWQIQHLKDPRSLVPGSAMPSFNGFTDDELNQLAHYLESLGTNVGRVSAVPSTKPASDLDPARLAFFERPARRDDEAARAVLGGSVTPTTPVRELMVTFGTPVVATIEQADGDLCLWRLAEGGANSKRCTSRALFAANRGAWMSWRPAGAGAAVHLIVVPDEIVGARLAGQPLTVNNNVILVVDGLVGTIEGLVGNTWTPIFTVE